MKKALPYLVFAGVTVIFLWMVRHYSNEMPERMVGHFNGAGKPTGKMPASEFFGWMIFCGLVVPVLLIACLYPIRFLSPKLLNTPYPDYWHQPANFHRACEFMLRSSMWFNAAFVVWTIGLMCLVVAANQETPVRLNLTALFGLTGFLIVVSIVWTVILTKFFARKPASHEMS